MLWQMQAGNPGEGIDNMTDGSFPSIALQAFLLLLAAEFGDKTQLLSMTLAARFGIRLVAAAVLLATAVLQLAAVMVGRILGGFLSGPTVTAVAGLVFIAFGIYMLFEKEESEEKEAEEDASRLGRGRSFTAVAVVFFLAELGDKTQLATVALAGRTSSIWPVWLGATLGMYAANLLAIVAGGRLKAVVSLAAIKRAGAVIFILFGLFTLWKLF